MAKPLFNILLIEDDEDDALIARATLDEVPRAEYRLEWVTTYSEGLTRLTEGNFDAALIDYNLGERNGLEFIAETMHRGISVPLILLTGQTDGELDVDALGAGAADFLSKGQLSSNLLERSIRYAVQRKKSEQDRLGLLREQAARERAEAAAQAVRRHAQQLEAEIAERSRVEGALRESEGNFRNLADAMPQIVWSSGADGAIRYLNKRWYEITGIEPGRELDSELRRRVIHPDDHDRTVEALHRSLEHGDSLQIEYRLRTATGHYRWQLVRSVPVRDEQGRITSWFGTSTDIDDYKRAEQVVADHARRLAASNAELESFAYVASHDLKEPLRGISAYAEMLLEDLGPVAGPDEREKLQTLVRLCSRMYALLDSLLEFSRVGRAEVALAQTPLSDIVKDVLEQLRPRLESERVTVQLAELPVVACDRVRLTQVFSNLIVNAIKYNSKPEKRVEIGIQPQPGASDPPVIFVRDNGIGISPRNHDAVFRVFRRLHARDAYGGGTGIGLAIVKKIIQHHGGRIWLESTPGEGTTFFFTLAPAVTVEDFPLLPAISSPAGREAGLIEPRRTSTVGADQS